MKGPLTLLKRALVFTHRWLGVALSVILLLWFVSGMVMLYHRFPSVRALDRLDRLPVLDPARIKLSAGEAFSALSSRDSAGNVLLTSFDGRPVYLSGGTMIYADDGREHRDVDDAMIDRAAAAWSGQPLNEATKTAVDDVDQWTLSSELRKLRPMYKYSWPDGQQVYVDGTTADVVQYTTTSSRFWAYLGAIPHWLYFTPLRVQQRTWFSLVVWSSLVGTVTTVIGMAIAAWMYSPRRRYRHVGVPTSIAYRGWKRWHTIAGLAFGVIATTWVFSGLLTMGPFPIMDRLAALTVPSETEERSGGRPHLDLSPALRGLPLDLAAYRDKSPSAAITSVPDFDVKEIEFASFDGAPMYFLFNGDGETRVVPVDGQPLTTFDPADLMRRVSAAAGGQLAELRLMDAYDAYYLDRRGALPLPVIYARMDDAVGTRFYINPKTATMAGSYSSAQWIDRWLIRGLHSLDFPWLYNNRPLWDVVVISLMLGGTALCMTSIVLTWRVVTRTLTSLWRRRGIPPTDDLVDPAREDGREGALPAQSIV